jgi:uncharacterized RDD family membrane protein YckC
MKCPKCAYIGFEATNRCRNCGYDFSLAVDRPADADLPLRADEATAPMGDFDLDLPTRPAPGARVRRREDPLLDPEAAGPPGASTPDLPLFLEDPTGEAPMVRPAAAPPPLAVRRSTPTPAKPRPRPTPRPADRELALLPADAHTPADSDAAAGTVRRLAAALLDVVLLGGVDLTVVYFTLRVCRLAAADLRVLPVWPLLGFLALLNGGYVAALTAVSGQTMGKMAFGLRVVSSDGRPVSTGQAIVRAVLLLVSAVPAGLGLVPALFDRGRRGVHDRLAGTRVVRR